MDSEGSRPVVSVLVPCRNEAGGIEAVVRSILSQESPRGGGGVEVIVADGMSDDGTRQRLATLAAADPRVRVIDNPGRIVSTGLNAAIVAARGEIIVRMDAHTEYAPDYVRQCVDVLEETGAGNVGGPWVARGDSYLSRAVAAAFQSPFAAGAGRAHDTHYEGPLDTVYLGCWRKETLDGVGRFDERLVRNQDDELNLRLTRAGLVVWQSPRIRSWYRPRSSLGALFRQYLQYGYWKVRVIRKHRRPASARHLVPALFVVGLCVGWVAGFVHWFFWAAYLGVVLLYAVVNVYFSLRAAAGAGAGLLPVLPLVFATFHVGYGLGFAAGVVDFLVFRRDGRASMTRLTRPTGG